MDLTGGRERLELSWVITPTGETIMSALHGYHAASALSEHAVAQAIPLSGGVMCVHDGRHPRQGGVTELAQQHVDVGGNPVKVKVSIHFPEMRGLDIALPIFGCCENNLVQASTSSARVEEEITVGVRLRIAYGQNSNSTRDRIRLVD